MRSGEVRERKVNEVVDETCDTVAEWTGLVLFGSLSESVVSTVLHDRVVSCVVLLVYSFIWRDLGLSGVCTCLTLSSLSVLNDLLGSLVLLRSLYIGVRFAFFY